MDVVIILDGELKLFVIYHLLILLFNSVGGKYMGRKGEYMSLSVPYDRYLKNRREFDKHVDSEDTYTQWFISLGEGAIERIKYLEKNFSDLRIVKFSPGVCIVDDSKKDDVVKVTFDKSGIRCSDKSRDTQRYIEFALMHTEFRPSND